MRCLLLLGLLALTACTCTAPNPDFAALDGGWWTVTLSEGPLCHIPYLTPSRDSADEAVRDCRRAG